MLKPFYYLPIIAISPVIANSFSVVSESNDSSKWTVEPQNAKVYSEEITIIFNPSIGFINYVYIKDLHFLDPNYKMFQLDSLMFEFSVEFTSFGGTYYDSANYDVFGLPLYYASSTLLGGHPLKFSLQKDKSFLTTIIRAVLPEADASSQLVLTSVFDFKIYSFKATISYSYTIFT